MNIEKYKSDDRRSGDENRSGIVNEYTKNECEQKRKS